MKYTKHNSAIQTLALMFLFYLTAYTASHVVPMGDIHVIMLIGMICVLIIGILISLFLLAIAIQYCLDSFEGSKLVPILYITLINALYTALFISFDNSPTFYIIFNFGPFLIISALVYYCYRCSKEAEAYESSDSDDAPSDFYEKQKEMF